MKVLVVVDVQKDFVDGALGTAEAQAAIPFIEEKIKSEDLLETMVVFTKDTHGKDYLDTFEGKRLPVEHCIECTPGWSIVKSVSALVDDNTPHLYYSNGDTVIRSRFEKNTFGSVELQKFFNENKDEIDEIEFIGFCTDICVISNALMARMVMPDKVITVDAKCCAGVTPEKHAAALEVMKSCQIDVINE